MIIPLLLFCTTPALAQAPTLINFQGKLTDANQAPVDGTADIVCSVYDAAGGGTLLWSEAYPAVPVSKGIFNVLLGNGNPNTAAIPGPYFTNLAEVFAAYPEAWMEVEVDGEAMTPRQRLVSVAYSLHAQTSVAADDVPGKDITPNSVAIPSYGQVIDSLGQWTGVTIPSAKLEETDPQVEAATVNRLPKWNGNALVDSASINETAAGNVGIGTAAPGEKLSVNGKIQTSEGVIFPDGNLQEKAGVVVEKDPQVDDLLSTNQLPKWNGEKLVDSQSIYEDGNGSVGVGTATPQQRLDVEGNIKVGFDSSICNSGKAGSLRWNPSKLIFEGCNGKAWLPLGKVGGSSSTEPRVHWGECRIVHANQGTASCRSREVMVAFNTDYMGPIPSYCNRTVRTNSVTSTCQAQYFSYDWHTVGSGAWAKCCAYY